MGVRQRIGAWTLGVGSGAARRAMWAGAAFGAFVALWAVVLSAASAQAPGDDPGAAFAAARAHLAAEIGASDDEITLARAEPVTWNNGCLGLAAAGEFCTEALVEGWVLWLRGPDAVYRLHTDADGSVIRSAGAVDVTSSIPELPLPDGATLRATAAPAPGETGSGGLLSDGARSTWVIGLLLAVAGGAVVLGRWSVGRDAGA